MCARMCVCPYYPTDYLLLIHIRQLKLLQQFLFHRPTPPSWRLDCRFMVLSDPLRALLVSGDVPTGFIEWIEKAGIVTVSQFALIATNEERLDTKIIEGNHRLVLEMIDEVNIRGAWASARASLDAPSSASIGPGSSAAPLAHVFAPGVEERLASTWVDRHRINLLGTELLSTKFLAQIYSGLQKSRKSLPFFALDQLRLKSDLVVPGLAGLVFDGSSLAHVSTSLDLDKTCAATFAKISAYVTSIAYVSADCPDFFDWEVCRKFLQILYSYVCLRMDNKEPTLKAVAKAWMLTYTEFATQVQNHQKSLNDLIADNGSWNHHWRDMELSSLGTRTALSSSVPASEAAAAGLPRDVVEMLATQAKLISELQGSFSRLEGLHRNSQLESADPAAVMEAPRKKRRHAGK